LHAIMDKSAEGRLKSIGNTMTVRKNPQENGEQLNKFPLNLKFLCATLPRSRTFTSVCSLLDLGTFIVTVSINKQRNTTVQNCCCSSLLSFNPFRVLVRLQNSIWRFGGFSLVQGFSGVLLQT